MRPRWKEDGERLVLAFGLPRSGTSWLGKILDSHPDTLYRHEPDKGYRSEDMPALFPLSSLNGNRQALRNFVDVVLDRRGPSVSAKLPLLPKSYYSAARFRLRRSLALGAKLSARVRRSLPVPDLIPESELARVHLVWKSITSVGRMGALMGLLGRARGVLLIRHPCGHIASILRGVATRQFGANPPASELFREFEILIDSPAGRAYGLTIEGLHALQPIERLAWRWVLLNEIAVAELSANRHATVVRYEDLCRDPKTVARALLDHCGLDWHSQVGDFITSSTSGQREDFYGLQKDPETVAGRWRDELSPAQSGAILDIVRRSPMSRYVSD